MVMDTSCKRKRGDDPSCSPGKLTVDVVRQSAGGPMTLEAIDPVVTWNRWGIVITLVMSMLPWHTSGGPGASGNYPDAAPINVRHDVDDSLFVALGERFKAYMCHLNLPDCEGAMIDAEWAVSAAHCAVEIRDKLERGGQHEVIINGELIGVDKVVIHRKYSREEAYDLALLHLCRPAIGSKSAGIYLGTDEVGQEVYVVGKGDHGTGRDGVVGNDGALRAATNRVEEATDYWLKWNFDAPGTAGANLTALEGVSGPGDSGGPAFIVRDDSVFVAGISSGQSTKNTGGAEGVYGVREYYVRVSRYVRWITGHMR